jgi:methyl-accepting chemotaxis protein
MNEVTAGVEQADIVRNKLEGMVTLANEVETQVNTVNRNSESNALEVEQISQFISLLTQHMNSSGQQVSHIADQAQAVSENAEHIHDVLGGVKLETIHHRMYEVAKEAVEDIQTVFEQAVQAGTVSIEDLFDREYVQIENTNPPKFHTRFDRFTDDVLPNIQEPILAQNAEVAYAGAVDNNGYFPTHNKCYAQDLTGNYQTDLANNRTKRIFSDRTGSRCGSHTKDFLLQTYKRDTGEVMHDLSVPIYINERHWGGFRIGYRSVIPNEENKLVESEDNDNQTDQVEFF